MSALAEGSLEALKLALWLWGSCVVSATPWVEKERGREREWETEMLSSCLAARLLQPKPVVVGQRGILYQWNQCCWMSIWLRRLESPFYSEVTKCAICIQLQHLLTWIKIMAGKLLHMLVTRCLLLWCQRKAKPIALSVSFTGQHCLCTYTSVCIKMSL